MYDQLLRAVDQYFDEVKVLRRSARGVITLLRHRKTGKRYVFRQFMGSADVYRRLLTVECPHLPRIEEAAARDGRVAVLEEYVQGDTLLFLLEGGLLDWTEAKKVTQDVCAALWVLHSLGAVHRDVKDSNVILRGSDAVLIDFDASRIVKPELAADTVVLGTTGYAARQRAEEPALPGLRRAGAVRSVPDRWPGGYLLPRRAAERDADGAAPLSEAGTRQGGAHRPALHHDEPRPALSDCLGAS